MSQVGPEELAASLRARDPAAIASSAGASLSEAGEICLEVLGESFVVTMTCHCEPRLLRRSPEDRGEGWKAKPARLPGQGPGNLGVSHAPLQITRPGDDTQRLPWFLHTLLLHYFTRADGTLPAGKWVALRDLPDGTFYHTAYQGYSGSKLVRAFGNDVEAFAVAAKAAGGERLELADAGFAFQALPRVPLAALHWAGEDEIPPKCSVLFDASAPHYLPTDVLAVLGGALADHIINQRR